MYCKDKPKSGPKPRKAIKKQSVKGKQKSIEKGMLHQNDAAFYIDIWQEREHIDFETGFPIYGELKTLYFHHVMEKSHFPQYRHCKWNIVLLAWQTHDQVMTNIDKLPKVKAYTIKLLKLHEQGKLVAVNPEKQFI